MTSEYKILYLDYFADLLFVYDDTGGNIKIFSLLD
jgi:hypothetical protein